MCACSATPTSAGTGTKGTPAIRQPVIASTVAGVGGQYRDPAGSGDPLGHRGCPLTIAARQRRPADPHGVADVGSGCHGGGAERGQQHPARLPDTVLLMRRMWFGRGYPCQCNEVHCRRVMPCSVQLALFACAGVHPAAQAQAAPKPWNGRYQMLTYALTEGGHQSGEPAERERLGAAFTLSTSCTVTTCTATVVGGTATRQSDGAVARAVHLERFRRDHQL